MARLGRSQHFKPLVRPFILEFAYSASISQLAATITATGGTQAVAAQNQNSPFRTISNSGGNWSATGTWVEGAVPTSANDVVATATSGQLTINVLTAACQSFDLTGYVSTLTMAASQALAVGSASGGKFILPNGMTLVRGSSFALNFVATSDNAGAGWPIKFGTTQTNLPNTTFNGVGGQWQFQDSGWAGATTGFQNLLKGTLDMNGQTFSLGSFLSSSSNPRSLIMGAANVTLTSTGTVWNAASTGLTFSPSSSTIVLTDTSVTGKTFAGGGLTYNNLSITGGGAGAVTFTGANTFANLPQIAGGTKSIVWPGSTTTTFTNGGNFGNGSNLITMTASAGSATLSFGSQVNADHLSLTNIIAAGTTPAYAGSNSTNGGGDTNWVFTPAPIVLNQVGATLTLAGGTQAVATVNYVSIAQVAATVTFTGGSQALSPNVNQVAATATFTGGTQAVASVQKVSISQLAATVTFSGEIQAALIDATQLAASLAFNGGTQIITTVRIVSISQLAATLTFATGTDIASQGVVITQLTGGLGFAGGTQSVKTTNIITWVSPSVTIDGGSQSSPVYGGQKFTTVVSGANISDVTSGNKK